MSGKIVDSEQLPVESKKYEDYFFRASAADFKKIQGSPVAYWMVKNGYLAFDTNKPLGSVAEARKGMVTARNHIYVRYWYEVDDQKKCFASNSREEARTSGAKWFPYIKGGAFRKWYGNKSEVVDWENDGYRLQTTMHPKDKRVWATNFNLEYIFKPNVNWSDITSGAFSARASLGCEIFDATGLSCFPAGESYHKVLGFLNSKVASYFLQILNPTLHFQAGNIAALPAPSDNVFFDKHQVIQCVKLHRLDWDSYETSWDFTVLPLLQSEYRQSKLKETYQNLLTHWQKMTNEMQRLEEENNRIFIEAYGLQDELTSDVPLKEITLTCNPHYRYGGDKTAVELESLLLADTMKEFISYAVGCMFGRYSLDKEGLILANQGETLADYLAQVPDPAFMPDDDNVIPVLDGEWFTDDVTERFRRFVKVTFGEEHYQENLAFIEQSIGKDIRKYFLKDFYADHVKRYKKRPIYWMFSSPKGSFNALIYMHRYQPTTASVVLNGYLREFRTKLMARKEHLEQVSISASVSQRDKTQALKEIEKLKKMIDELESWEREVLYPLAAEQIDIDLDDGVKLNYPKFGKALKKVVGLS